jgi:hypothetical protein
MKKILFLAVLFILSSCKTVYVYKGSEKMVVNDTINVPGHHYHYGDSACIYIEPWEIHYTDTLIIEIWKTRKRLK